MAEITVQSSDRQPDTSTFHVSIRDDDSSTEHDVTLFASDFDRLGTKYETQEDFVRACFAFLLDRESKPSFRASTSR